MVAAGIFNANIFGEIALLISELEMQDAELQSNLDNVNTAMRNLDIPEDLRDNIRTYLMSVHTNKLSQDTMKDFCRILSPKLK